MDSVNSSSSVNISLSNLKVSDEYTFKHSVDVATMGVLVGKTLGLNQKDLNNVAVAGILHDIGKTKIPNKILNKPGKLTDEEFKIMKEHPVFGYKLVENNKDLDLEAKKGILMHHEKVDGTGYPLHITAEKINLIGKLLAVVDVYDALVTKRPYRDNLIEPAKAVEMIMAMFNQFDVNILRAFLNCLVIYPIGTNLMLSVGKVYEVIAQNTAYPLRPVVRDIMINDVRDLLHDISCLSLTITSEV